MNTKAISYRIMRFPLSQIALGITICCSIVAIGQVGVIQLFKLTALDVNTVNLINAVVAAILIVGSYALWFGYYEKRPISELSLTGMVSQLMMGVTLGAVLQSLTILVIYLAADFQIISTNSFRFVIPALAVALAVAVVEEIIIRGIIFRIIEKRWGSYVALLLSALIFGVMHLANPNSSLIAALGLSIQAGLLLASAYIYTRSLWFPIAIHFAWNFTESGIFGAKVSGSALSRSLLVTKIDGAAWITGGEFGPEGSVQATLFCLLATICLLLMSHRQNKLLPPAPPHDLLYGDPIAP
ncbi:CPBP family intramembrane glutamic endopeptidase [Salmonirosea aquatica]|uniref:CPBP family intramembrane metalloprotease n=1 Tax=Salmonirosea aquatica TaxID=2654236 RepID=A0A7C9BM31_9BACT|nr:CPBP family intramembrane metalloprotease [Cytophagaceae bacterium SJW1-29]